MATNENSAGADVDMSEARPETGDPNPPPPSTGDGTALPAETGDPKPPLTEREEALEQYREILLSLVWDYTKIPSGDVHKKTLRNAIAEIVDCGNGLSEADKGAKRNKLMIDFIRRCRTGEVLWRTGPAAGESSSGPPNQPPPPTRTGRSRSERSRSPRSRADRSRSPRTRLDDKLLARKMRGLDIAGGSSRRSARLPTTRDDKLRELKRLRDRLDAAESERKMHVKALEELEPLRAIGHASYKHSVYQHHHDKWHQAVGERDALSTHIAVLEASI